MRVSGFEKTDISLNPTVAMLAAVVSESARANAAEQATCVFENIKAVLKEAGTDLKHVVKATVFLKSMDDFGSVNAVYAKAFEANEILPARSAVQVGKLPKDVMVEIEVIAVK